MDHPITPTYIKALCCCVLSLRPKTVQISSGTLWKGSQRLLAPRLPKVVPRWRKMAAGWLPKWPQGDAKMNQPNCNKVDRHSFLKCVLGLFQDDTDMVQNHENIIKIIVNECLLHIVPSLLLLLCSSSRSSSNNNACICHATTISYRLPCTSDRT